MRFHTVEPKKNLNISCVAGRNFRTSLNLFKVMLMETQPSLTKVLNGTVGPDGSTRSGSWNHFQLAKSIN